MKKVFALFLALLMVVSCMVILPVAAEDATEIKPWDGKSTTPEGSGREKDPYIIDSAGDLAWLAANPSGGGQMFSRLGRDGKIYFGQYFYDAYFTQPINTMDKAGENYVDPGSDAFKTGIVKYAAYHLPMVAADGSKMDWFDKIYVKQTCDIDMGGYSVKAIGGYWSVKGQGIKGDIKGQFFCGEYDGQGYTIKNGKWQNTGTNGNWANGAMFGLVWGATIKNIKFENMESLRAGGRAASLCVGRAVSIRDFNNNLFKIVGYEKVNNAKTLIENIIVGDGCTIGGTGGEAVGGILAEGSNVTVKNCVSLAYINVPGTVDRIGGIMGRAYDDVWIEKCLYAGKINVYNATAMLKANNEAEAVERVANASELHISGILGSWTAPYDQEAARKNPTQYTMGKGGIVDCVNLGGVYADLATSYKIDKGALASFSSTICFGGILGATSGLWTAGTGATYTFNNNANLSNNFTLLGVGNRRAAGLVGCFFYANNNTNIPLVFNPKSPLNQIVLEDCFNASHSYVKLQSGHANVGGVCTSYKRGTNPQGAVKNTVNYTRGSHYKALASESPYPYVDADPTMAALDAKAVSLYERYFNQVNEIIFDGAAGTAEDPYKVDSVNALNWISMHVGTANSAATERLFRAAWAGKYFVQTADIDLKGATIWSMGNYLDKGAGLVDTDLPMSPADDLAAGYRNVKGNTFSGYYNGQGWSIKNGMITNEASGKGNNNWASGLFGVIYGATLKNITLDNMTHTANSTGGLLVGVAFTDISKDKTAYVAGAAAPAFDADYSDNFNVIDGCRVVNSTLNIASKHANASFGAIAGSATATTIRNCYTDNVKLIADTGNLASVGGILGFAGVAVKIENCISGSDIVKDTANGANTTEQRFGGIVGMTWTLNNGDFRVYTSAASYENLQTLFSMTNCVNMGGFELKGTACGYVNNDPAKGSAGILYGGLIGSAVSFYNCDATCAVTNCFNLSDDVVVPDGYDKKNNLRVGGLVGCRWTAGPADEAPLVLVNCGSVEGPAVSANGYKNEKGESATGKFNLFNYYSDRFTVDGEATISLVNSSEVPAVAKTEKELGTLDALVSEIINEMTKGVNAAIPVGATADVDDRDRLTVTFYAAIDEDVKKYDIVNVVYNIAMIEDGKVSTYTMNFNGFVTNATAPAGYNLVTEYSLPVGKKADATLDFVYTVTVYTADGAVRSGYVAGGFTVVNGEIAE